ncbi:MAG: YraN family protein [Fervidobacterium sp.]|jgi:putative endonuclease
MDKSLKPKKNWQLAEDKAAEYLKNVRKYKIIERNLKTPFGEIDIIAKKGKKFIFVEVKSGTGRKIKPSERVDQSKYSKLIKSAEYFLKGKNYEKVQFDIIEVIEEELIHYEDIGWDFS